MSDSPLFDKDKLLGEAFKSMSCAELIELAAKLCDAAFRQRDNNGFCGGIRPDNISVDDEGTVAIGASETKSSKDWSKEELEYLAPELFWDGCGKSCSDVYAIGLILYAGINDGKLPFIKSSEPNSEERAEALKLRMSGEPIPMPWGVGKKLSAMIAKAISFKEDERYENALQLGADLRMLTNELTSVNTAAVFGKQDSELSEIEQMMVEIISRSALDEDIVQAPVAEEEPQEEIVVEIVEQPADDIPEPEPELEPAPEPEPEPEPVPEPEPIPEPAPAPVPEQTVVVEVKPAPAPKNAPAKNAKSSKNQNSKKKNNKNSGKKPAPAAVAPQKKPQPSQSKKAPAAQPSSSAQRKSKPKRKMGIRPLIIVAVLIAAVGIAAWCLRDIDGGSVPPTPSPASTPELSAAPVQTAEPTPTPEPTPEPVEHSYHVIKQDVAWDVAEGMCKELGGHLVTINDEEEFQQICRLADESGAKYIWIGCYRSNNGALTWLSGEEVSFYNWAPGEPSVTDSYDGSSENYIMLSRQRDGSWMYNDSRMDPLSAYSRYYSGNIAFICEIGG